MRARGLALAPWFASVSFFTVALAAASLSIGASGCSRSDLRLARRILDDHRRQTGTRPLPISQVLTIALSAPGRPPGTLTVEWDPQRYRETLTSSGITTVRGIQVGKAYYRDEDGVTRVVSDPVLAELVTRSYFFRRAYLFDDAERAKLALGPAEPSRVAIELTPRGGNPLRITLDRKTLHVEAVSSIGLELSFESPTRWRDQSRADRAVEAELRHAGLPSETLADTSVGGWSAAWPDVTVSAPLLDVPGGAAVVAGSVGGRPASIAIDAGVPGPVRVRRELAARLGSSVAFREDVFGRRIGEARLEIAGWSEKSVHLEVTDDIPAGADAAAGGTLFREAIVEFDGANRMLRLHDPAPWVRVEGYYRCILDDDGDEPVAILQKHGERVRATAGTSAGSVPSAASTTTGAPPGSEGPVALALLASAAERLRLAGPSGSADGLHWGPAPLPPEGYEVLPGQAAARFSAAHPHVEGRLSTGFLLRFRVLLDMTHRWAYLKPESGPTPPRAE
jgi:hypothetical protein